MLPATMKRNLILVWTALLCHIQSSLDSLDRFSWKPQTNFTYICPVRTALIFANRQSDRQIWWKKYTLSAAVRTSLKPAVYGALSKLQNWTISSSVPRTLSYSKQLSIAHWSSWKFQWSSSYVHH